MSISSISLVNKLKQLTKMQQMLLTSFVVILAMVLYILLIGIPRTKARNLYNTAQILEQIGKVESAEELYTKAYAAWPESYIEQAMNR